MSKSEYFDSHWDSNKKNTIPTEKIKVAENFIKPIFDSAEFKPSMALDVGCGDAVHLEVVKALNKNIKYEGIDISKSVIERLKRIHQNDIQTSFSHGDALQLPYKDLSYDIVFSFGVLGYTKNPKKGFSEMVRVCKKGGKIGLWLYPKKKGLLGVIFNITRWISIHSHDFLKKRIADIIVPFLSFLPTQSGLNLSNANWKQCREVVMVNIAPENLIFFEEELILKWFDEHKIKVDINDKDNDITVWGTKL